MKKTVTVNLNGRVFTMDEDAYQLLDSYLQNLRIYFRKEEGSDEIISDFEARIEELLSERLRLGYEVITIKEVEDVIARVGRPDELFDEPLEEEPPVFNQKINEPQGKKKFFRNPDDKMFGGICSGISAYFGWDVLPVRIVFVILLFATQFIIVPFYLLAWIIFPSAKTAEEKLRMSGKPITVENIGKTVAAEAEKSVHTENRGCLGSFLDFFVGFLKVCLIGFGILIAIPILFCLFIAFVVLIAFLVAGFGIASIPFSFMDFSHFPFIGGSSDPLVLSIAVIVLIGIPVIALVYAIIAYFAKFKPLHKSVKWVCLVIWLVALVSFIILTPSSIRKISPQWNWKWSVTTDEPYIEGNGQLADKEFILTDPIESIIMKRSLWSNLQIEQIPGDSTFILVSGDENLIDKVEYSQKGGDLILSTLNNAHLRSDNNLIIRVQTPELNRIKSHMLGNVSINKPFQSDKLDIMIEGAGHFQADELNVGNLKVKSQGVGAIILSGNARKADFIQEGVGEINAYNLQTDSVIARVDGVGSVRCDPVKYLKGDVNGIGKITYKSEPETKNAGIVGMGAIKKGD